MPPQLEKLVAREILDSRGNPTVEVDVYAVIGGVSQVVARGGAPSVLF
jgi:enolase